MSEVIATLPNPAKTEDRMNTEHQDTLSLTALQAPRALTPDWVPGKEQEAVQDLIRAREDMIAIERHAQSRLEAFLLRHNKAYSGKSKWTRAHSRWLESVKFATPAQQSVFQEYLGMVKQAQRRVSGLEAEMRKALKQWSLAPVMEKLMALRGVNLITAMTVVAELGDITRFDSPRALMAHLRLIPSEHSSGKRSPRGGITQTG